MTILHSKHYDISVMIRPERGGPVHRLYGGTIDVDCLVTVENRDGREATAIPFLLYRLLQVDAVMDDLGQSLSFTHTITGLNERPRQQVSRVVVTLPTPLASGGLTKIRLNYHGPICGYPEVFPYVQDHISDEYTLLRTDTLWFPVVGEPINGWPADAFTFNLTAIVPYHLTAVSNGQASGLREQSNGIAYHWHSSCLDPARRLTLVCAPFEQTRITPDVSLFYLPADHIGAQVVTRALRRALELCMLWFGNLPSRVLSVVEIPEGYGSEAAIHLILQTADTFKAEHSNDLQAYRQALSWIGHEVIHLWNAPSREKYVSRFLDESITHYLEALLLRSEFGDDAYWQRLESYRSHFLSAGEAAMSVPLSEAGLHLGVRDSLARGKGPWLLAALHYLIGDSLLVALRAFFNCHSTQGATLEDFQAAMPQSDGVDLSRLFQEWFWGVESSAYLTQSGEGRELMNLLVRRYNTGAG